jgi:hypothetical protein
MMDRAVIFDDPACQDPQNGNLPVLMRSPWEGAGI